MTEEGLPPAQPPHDLAAEKAVLRAMLRSPQAVADVIEILAGPDFHRPAHELIHDAVLTVHARGETPDVLTVTAELDRTGRLTQAGGHGYLHTLTSGSTTGDTWRKSAERVLATSVLRRTLQAAARIEDLVAHGIPHDLDGFVDTVQAEIHAATLLDRTPTPPDRPLTGILEGVLDELGAHARPADTGTTGTTAIPTGFADLDLLTGGFRPGQFNIIAARPALGSSTLALNFLRTASIRHGIPAALFSLEGWRADITMRLLSAEARVALHHMRSNTLTDDDWTRLARRMPDVSAAPLHIQDDGYATFSDLRAHCRRLHARHGLGMIVIDKLQLIPYGTRPRTSRYEEVSDICLGLTRLAKELQIPVLAVSTLSRGPERRPDKTPVLSDLRDSGVLEANADLVILIHREDAYDKDSPRAGEADLIVAKHRYGPTATLTVAYQGHYGRFVELAS
ncbi:replicative DNA helicase [Streptomyces sp. SPB4]|uniref:replicative DNA helicase n=1 Tax=Streptomyces sp. SPB4 TaxID=2940553 RepID=UPI0024754C6D|nr:replicative DNA helicase [Streptomyces sp. SPB4]MDH6543720.1 replicative DNA helicase [Streptomyces sp. SPB4]